MKKNSLIITILIVLFLAVFISCKEDDSGSGTDSEVVEAATSLTSNEWSPADAGSVMLDETSITGWENFSLQFSGDENGGTFTTADVPEGYENVWPAEGTWQFKSTNGVVDITRIVRINDGVEMNALIEAESLDLSFEYSAENGRVGSVTGEWTFNLQ